MDTVLAIIGIALSIAGIVPVFTQKSVRLRVAATAITLSIVGIFAYQIRNNVLWRSEVHRTKAQIATMVAGNAPMTIEQIIDRLNHVPFATVTAAVDELEREQVLHQRVLDVVSEHGTPYKVRAFNSVSFPVR